MSKNPSCVFASFNNTHPTMAQKEGIIIISLSKHRRSTLKFIVVNPLCMTGVKAIVLLMSQMFGNEKCIIFTKLTHKSLNVLDVIYY